MADDPVGAVTALRADLEAAKGPIVEALPGEHGDVLVTFIWIGAIGPVSVATPLLRGHPWSVPMARVLGSDVWYLSTRVRADITTSYQYRVDDPLLEDSRSPLEAPQEFAGLLEEAALRTYADPFNPDGLAIDSATPEEQWMSVLTLPAVEALHWFDPRAEASGTLEQHEFASAAMGNERTISIYTPPAYEPDGSPYPLVVMLDGEMWINAAPPWHSALDNLIAADRIPPVVVAFVNNAPSNQPPGATRAFEMTCNPEFPKMVADELLPMLRACYHVTTDPSRLVIAGPSFGGLAAAYIGFERPHAFGNVLACSPAAWWGYADDEDRFSVDENGHPQWLMSEREEPEWLTRQYAEAERKPLRFWISAGCLEVAALWETIPPGLDYRTAVRHLRTVLTAKGYDVTYYEAPGGHDLPTFRHSYVRGLQMLLSTGR